MINRTAALIVTTDAGLVWAWPNQHDDGRLNVVAVGEPNDGEPVQCARDLAYRAFGLDPFFPRLRLLAWTSTDKPHPAGWTHLYAWEGDEPQADTIVGTGWWDAPENLMNNPAALTPTAMATLRTAYGDAS